METYEPLLKGETGEWLKLDDYERIELVKAYHESLDEDFDDETMNPHSAMHVVVENQIALGETYVANAAAKLIRQGLSKHDAVHAIAAVMAEEIYYLLQGSETEFPIKKYRRKLEKLTAKRWRKGQI